MLPQELPAKSALQAPMECGDSAPWEENLLSPSTPGRKEGLPGSRPHGAGSTVAQPSPADTDPDHNQAQHAVNHECLSNLTHLLNCYYACLLITSSGE